MNELSMKIRDLRLESGLTQLELAQIANINRATIIAIEKGQNTSISTLQQVVEAMGRRLKITVQG